MLNIIAVIVIAIIFFIIGYVVKQKEINSDRYIINKPDTVYNKIVIDSLEYNIIKKDSIIYNIKENVKEEINFAINADDSTTIILFQKLGEIQLAPDSTCIVPIKLIKQANVKLIERNSFIKIIQEQEDIIKLQKLELKEYSVIVGDMQNRIVSYNTINNDLNKQIEQYKKRNRILIGTSCGVVVVAALILIIK